MFNRLLRSLMALPNLLPVTPGTLQGQYGFTAPFDGPIFIGFCDSPGWGHVKTFGIQNSTQFPVPPPYNVNSPEYTRDYKVIKRLGSAVCIASGGVENSAFGWNKIVVKLIDQSKPNAWKVKPSVKKPVHALHPTLYRRTEY
jgi:hypothetical protein